jgi:hypothetical protein
MVISRSSRSRWSRALVLFNRGVQPAAIGVTWTEIGYPLKLSAEVRDLWTHQSLGRKAGGFSATVAPHGVVMVRITLDRYGNFYRRNSRSNPDRASRG